MTKPRKPRTKYTDNLSAEMVLDAFMLFRSENSPKSVGWSRSRFNELLVKLHNQSASHEQQISISQIKNSRINQMFSYGLKKLTEVGVDTEGFELPPLRRGGKIGTDWKSFANKWQLKE